jgi:hypothetical protein
MRLTLNRSCVVTAAAVLALVAGSVAQDAQRHPKAAVRAGIVPGPAIVHQPFVSKELAGELHRALTGVGVPTVVAVSDFAGSFIDILKEDGTVLATLTSQVSFPEGMTTDRQGNLYVCDAGGGGILTYAAGFTSPPTLLTTADGQCANVAQRNNGNFLAVVIIVGSAGNGGVSFYRGGNHVGFATDSNILEAFNGAFDHDGNFYFDGLNESDETFVAEIAHATTGGRTVQYLTTTNSIGFPGDVKVTNAGLITIGDQDAASIYSYNPPSGGSLGSPVDTTVLTGSGDAVTYAYKVHNHNVYAADALNLDANEWAYPAGGSEENTISIPGAAEPLGTALIPVQMP